MRGVIAKRDCAAWLLSSLGVTSLQLRRGSGLLRMLAYHRVRDLPQSFKHDPELVSASRAQFLEQMGFVKKHFTPISFLDLERIVDGEMECPANPIIVTFDDGFDDNYSVAFPILERAGGKGDLLCRHRLRWHRTAFVVVARVAFPRSRVVRPEATPLGAPTAPYPNSSFRLPSTSGIVSSRQYLEDSSPFPPTKSSHGLTVSQRRWG